MMERIEVEVLSHAVNSAVIRLPYRRFPGVLIQGDSLRILYDSLEELHELCKDNKLDEATELASETMSILAASLLEYEAALGEHNLDLPYFHAITTKYNPKATER